MNCLNICEILHDICSANGVADQLENQTLVQVWVDQFGNLFVIDTENELGPALDGGNFSGDAPTATRFHLDRFGNFKYTYT